MIDDAQALEDLGLEPLDPVLVALRIEEEIGVELAPERVARLVAWLQLD